MEVPAISRVHGTSATSKIMKGTERTVLTKQRSTSAAGRLCSDCPPPTRDNRMPIGPPISSAAVRPMASMVSVAPNAVHISGSMVKICSSMRGLLPVSGVGCGDIARQLASQRGAACAPNVGQRELFGDGAVLDHGDAVTDVADDGQLVADDDDGHAEADRKSTR